MEELLKIFNGNIQEVFPHGNKKKMARPNNAQNGVDKIYLKKSVHSSQWTIKEQGKSWQLIRDYRIEYHG